MLELAQKLENLLEEKFKEEEFSQLFLIDIQFHPNDTIHVFMDSDAGITLEQCVSMSRFIEHHIEANAWLGESYTLEVSSPGVGAPLKLHRQYLKNIGRTVSVDVKDSHINIKGTLTTVNENSIVVEYPEKVLVEGSKKKKQTIMVQQEILMENIKKTIVKISFS